MLNQIKENQYYYAQLAEELFLQFKNTFKYKKLIQAQMKALLGLAKQRKKQGNFTQNQKVQLPPSEPSDQEEDVQFDQGEYQPTEQEFLAYAEYLGIQLPEEEDLLWIANEGLQAELPPDWRQGETQNGQIVYTNIKTKEVTFQHPCDGYYKQLVIKERKKQNPSKISMKSNNQQTMNQLPNPLMRQLQPQIITDPLIKMQKEKEIKKLQQNKRKQFADKKSNITKRHQQKKDQIQQDFKKKEQKTKKKYDDQLQEQKKKLLQKMNAQERQEEHKKIKQLNDFQKQIKQKEERLLVNRKRQEKQLIQKKYAQKKQQIKLKLENQLKKQKKAIDDTYLQKNKQLERKQKIFHGEDSHLQNQIFEQQVQKLKNDIIRRKMKEHSEQIKIQQQRQKQIYRQQVAKLQKSHDQKVKKLQQNNQPKKSIQMDQFIKEIQAFEKDEMKQFQYELSVMKEMKQIQNQEKIQTFKVKMNELQKEEISKIVKQFQVVFQKFKELKQEEFQAMIWETQKKSKQDYLKALKKLQGKYELQQEVILLQNHSKNGNQLEKQSLQNLEKVCENLEWEQNKLRRQRQNIRLEIDNLKSQNISVLGKMNEQQSKLYNLIQEKIKSNYKK